MKQIKVSIKLGDIHSIKLELTSFGEKKGADKYIYVTRINSSLAGECEMNWRCFKCFYYLIHGVHQGHL